MPLGDEELSMFDDFRRFSMDFDAFQPLFEALVIIFPSFFHHFFFELFIFFARGHGDAGADLPEAGE